jgi:signal transduction histidine kinase/DNA-binding NarL/FixJ family response regulator
MSSPGLKFSAQPMNGEAVAAALLELEGYAAFEYLGHGQFQIVGTVSRLATQLVAEPMGSAAPIGSVAIPGGGGVVRLAERIPFLESFLPDAEDCWNSGTDGRVESGSWIERAPDGREVALEASAFRLAEKRILLIRNPQRQFAEESGLLQKARESVLVHERLQREIQKKEIVLHCVIHDLSQPLTAMRGCFSLLAAENLSPQLREIIEIGQRQSRSQEEMIRGILQAFSAELAAQDSIAHPAANSPDLARTAQQVAQDYSAAFAARGARIETDPQIDFERIWRVVGDESRLRRIYANLIENALRYSTPDSTVTLGLIDEGDFLRAYVDDEGPGLPTGDGAPRLFSLFAKGAESGGKAGLGLYFCKITVERWGGAIGAEHRPTRGTRFWFRLPKVEERAGEAAKSATGSSAIQPAARAQAEPGRRLRLLLADDTPVNRQITKLLLEKQGHEVVAVEDGIEALTRLNGQSFDAVILDEQMPGMSGLEAAREIRKKEAGMGQHIPIILVTGNGSDAARQRSREAGVDAHIAKPFQDEEFFRTVNDLCGGAPPAPAAAGAPEKSKPSLAKFDEQELLRRVGGSAKMLRDVARIFVQDTPKRKSAIRKAAARKDGAALATAAHALRGSVAMLGAVDLADEIHKVETLGREGSVGQASEFFGAIESSLSAFETLIAGLARGSGGRTKPVRAGRGKQAPGKAR